MVIFTKFHGPTNTRGARVSARVVDWGIPPVFVSYDYALTVEGAHAAAVRALLDRIEINSENFRIQSIPGGFVFIQADARVISF